MSILDYFDLNDSATITRIDVTNDGQDHPVDIETEIGVFDCIFWEGSTGESFTGGRFREELAATIGMYPGPVILKDDIVVISGVSYHVLGSDDVGHLGEALIVYLKEFS